MSSLNLIAIPPAVFVVLDTIIEYEDVGLLNLMEVAPPRDVARLENDALHKDLGLVVLRNSSANMPIRSASTRRPSRRNSPPRIPPNRKPTEPYAAIA